MPEETLPKIRVLIAERNHLAGDLLSKCLAASFSVVESTTTAAETLAALRRDSVDVAIVSLQLGDSSTGALEVLKELGRVDSAVKTIVLVDIIDSETAVSVFQNGARGVISRGASSRDFPKCVAAVYAGQVWVPSEQLLAVLSAFQFAPHFRVRGVTGKNLLSDREQQLIPLVGEGLTNREIAEKLHVSEHTVKNHLFRIYEKLGISSRVELILYATYGTQTA